MPASAKPEIKAIIEIVVQKRLGEHLDDMEQRKKSIERGAAQPAAPQGVIARGFLVDSWAESLSADHRRRACAAATGGTWSTPAAQAVSYPS
jgi:hypothetical protein